MSDLVILVGLAITAVTAATPLLLAALGELVSERSGVLNLGVEGMMAVGAIGGFAAAYLSGSLILGVLAAMVAGMMLAAAFGFLVLNLGANQVASGLSLTLLGLGIASMAGETFVGRPGAAIASVDFGPLSDIPVAGPLLFSHDPLFYLALATTAAVAFILHRTHFGLTLRAVGINHASAHELGIPVLLIRWAAVLFGGAMAGLAGGYLSLVYTPLWNENMTAGRGWIALALVVFSSWRPWRTLAGAYLFGFVTIAGFHAQSFGVRLPSQFISALPYLVTILVLVVISRNRAMLRAHTPAELGKPFVPAR